MNAGVTGTLGAEALDAVQYPLQMTTITHGGHDMIHALQGETREVQVRVDTILADIANGHGEILVRGILTSRITALLGLPITNHLTTNDPVAGAPVMTGVDTALPPNAFEVAHHLLVHIGTRDPLVHPRPMGLLMAELHASLL